MKGIVYILVMGFIVAMHTSEVVAGNKGSGDTYAFLRIGVSARAAGMGNAYVAIADDASAVCCNPAGLASLKKPEISLLMYRPPVISEVGDNYGYVNGILPWRKVGIGITGILLKVGNIEETVMGDYEEPIILGKFENREYAIIGGIGYEVLKNLCSLGINLKYINHKLYKDSGEGYGGDLGCLINLSEAWDWRGIFKRSFPPSTNTKDPLTT